VKERLGVPVRSSIFRFLHLPTRCAIVPKTITSTTNAIKSDRDPRVAAAARVAESLRGNAAHPKCSASGPTARSNPGVLTVAEDGLAVAAASAAGVPREVRSDDTRLGNVGAQRYGGHEPEAGMD
jgi:hypothetical protein